ncbi:MAG: hypothetical protein ACI9V1_003724 [Spirosomataceae bacterium]|jgi:hypothetical protein
MENLIAHTYAIVGLKSEDGIEEVENRLDAAAGVVGVTVNFAKKEVELTSYEEIDIATLEQALSNTDWYITKPTANNWVAAPSFRKVAANVRQKHNSAKNIEGESQNGLADTGPSVDYDRT